MTNEKQNQKTQMLYGSFMLLLLFVVCHCSKWWHCVIVAGVYVY